jgi:hypothetical protein
MRPNPYKIKGQETTLHKIACDVSENDFYYFTRALGTLRGPIDQTLSKLFLSLVTEMRARDIPDYYLATNEYEIEEILRGLTFTRTPRSRREQTDSGRSENLFPGDPSKS